MDDQQKRETLFIRSTIQPELLRLKIRQGGWIAGAGALLLVIGGTFFPLEVLKMWGIPLFFTGLILVAIGILPYRRLTRIQLKPHELHYDGQNLLYFEQGKPQLRIPQSSIETLSYVEKDELYGLSLKLKRPFQEKIAILNPKFDLKAFLTKSAEKFPQGDLFLPYFSKRSYQEATSWLQDTL